MKTLVVGIGNTLMKDEGIGLRVVEVLRGRDLPRDVELVEAGTSMFEVLSGRGGGRLIVIDAAANGMVPGSVQVHRGRQQDFAAESGGISVHDRGLPEALGELAIAGDEWDEVVIYGVEPDDVGLGEELTPPVRKALDEAVRAVEKEVTGRTT